MNTDLADLAAYDIMVELNLMPDTRLGSLYPSQMEMWDKMTEIIASHYTLRINQRDAALRTLQNIADRRNCHCADMAQRTIQRFRTEPKPVPKQVGRILDL